VSTASERVAGVYLDACIAELHALKPGNVHVHADGHGMTVRDFERSAHASAPAMGEPGLSVGARIHEAIRRTHDAVGCNTNLGIVLLCAPLAVAAFVAPTRGDLRSALRGVLASLSIEDAELTFAAIRRAAPAGLGDSAEQDVKATPTATLLEAMRLARARDRIAAQYVTDYADVCALGVRRLEQGLARWHDLHWAATSAYLGFLTAFPDSHVARKHGAAAAAELLVLAKPHDDALRALDAPAAAHADLMAFDAELKARGYNPGTSADLTVASLFAFKLQREII
jgi:triphosphoribosyl-dephospho-CoA synthase